jgi:carboxypeptidase Taq
MRRATPSTISLGIHESQSRLWENLVGRGRPFAHYLHGLFREFLPELAASHSPELIWQRVNHVTPSLIRVEADEVTYSLHIIIRLLLEEALIAGELVVPDLPGAWGEYYERYLGVRPSSDEDGVLQDVHWYMGAIGYFSTYALGNLYGAMMMEEARRTLPTLDDDIAAGRFGGLLAWLQEGVFRHGKRFTGPQLIQGIAGRPLSVAPFVKYIREKHGV